jgi:hypothetical protein
MLDYDRLALRPFAPGAIIRVNGKFHRIADPWRQPRDLWSTLTAPIGTMADRLRVIRLVLDVRRGSPSHIFQKKDVATVEFLRSKGFSETIVQKFFKPFFAAEKSPTDGRYLVLNGNGTGWVNSLTVPSSVAPSYSPAGQHLISVVVIGHWSADNATVESMVRQELTEWFGGVVNEWRHLKTYRIVHALPEQKPPMPDPTMQFASVKPGIYVCGEYGSIPGIQWALLSGRQTAESILKMIHSQV